jgi:hypothetical protein
MPFMVRTAGQKRPGGTKFNQAKAKKAGHTEKNKVFPCSFQQLESVVYEN